MTNSNSNFTESWNIFLVFYFFTSHFRCWRDCLWGPGLTRGAMGKWKIKTSLLLPFERCLTGCLGHLFSKWPRGCQNSVERRVVDSALSESRSQRLLFLSPRLCWDPVTSTVLSGCCLVWDYCSNLIKQLLNMYHSSASTLLEQNSIEERDPLTTIVSTKQWPGV